MYLSLAKNADASTRRRLAVAQLTLQSFGFSVWYRGGTLFSLLHQELEPVHNIEAFQLLIFASVLSSMVTTGQEI